jgi:hypothetical protein
VGPDQRDPSFNVSSICATALRDALVREQAPRESHGTHGLAIITAASSLVGAALTYAATHNVAFDEAARQTVEMSNHVLQALQDEDDEDEDAASS